MELTPKRPAGPDVRGLLSSRQATFGVALVCALVAGGIIALAVSGYRSNVNASSQQVTVLVAKNLIQKGTAGDAVAAGQLAIPSSILQKQVSAGAISDAAAIRGKVAAHDVLPGEQITAADFTGASGVAASLAPTQRAVAVTVDQEHGLVGLLQTGDHVDVYGGFNIDQGSGQPRPIMKLLVPDVPVMRANNGGGSIGGGAQSTTVLLAVNDLQAGKLAFAAENGKVWLVLRPGNAAATPPTFQDLGSVLLGTPGLQTATITRAIGQILAKASQ